MTVNTKPASTAMPSALAAETLQRAQQQARVTGRPTLECLEQSSGQTTEQLLGSVSQLLQYPLLDMRALHAAIAATDYLSLGEMLGHECILLRDPSDQVYLVVSDPFDTKLRQWADARITHPFSIAMARKADIGAWLASRESGLKAMESLAPALAADANSGEDIEELSYRGISEDASPVVKTVNSTIYDALRANASDIHLESTPNGMNIKYRIDGVLGMVGSAPNVQMAEQIISRVKVMADLDISEHRVPQDGRLRVSMANRAIDLRVSIMPSVHGEDCVLRILDKQALSDQIKGLQLTTLGFDPAIAKVVRRLAAEPYGMLLVTGPTGSGKTTTIYAAISEINHGTEKIVTIEDPVEYNLPGVLQIPVNEKKGLTFARGLRSILRHDPDKIMVGEIRDPETAQIAIQSALTGHLVFTTVHANNVFDVLGRFMHMGVDMFGLVSALNGVLAQRLVRMNCAHCAEPVTPTVAQLADAGLTPAGVHGWQFKAGKGCAHCRGSGYKGRRAIAELLLLNDEIRELMIARAPTRALKEAARRNGTQFLRDSALDVVRAGETTLQEINRVTLVT
jgi:general secretion pathway protein E